MCPIDTSMLPMLDTFIYETTTLLEQLDEIMLEAEKVDSLGDEYINEIFRIMHTIKGSSAMMGAENMATISHSVEDLFFLIREDAARLDSRSSQVFDLVFKASDFLKTEIDLVSKPDYIPSDAGQLIDMLAHEVDIISGKATRPQNTVELDHTGDLIENQDGDDNTLHSVRIFFEDGCQMENIRAFMLMTQLKEYCQTLYSEPQNPESDSNHSATIIKNGFIIYFKSLSLQNVLSVIENSINIKSYEVLEGTKSAVNQTAKPDVQRETTEIEKPNPSAEATAISLNARAGKQSFISVNQSKLDQLMDLMGELVITESMVTNNPDLKGLPLDNFNKSTRQLRKLTDELQDIIMSIRMVPLSGLFQKMNRISRDMGKKLNKLVDFESVGGETEVDKSINDIIGDPLMHMIRNSVDHAIESPEERSACGKSERGKVSLTAQNIGGEIVIAVEDDGKGLDAELILAKAKNLGLLTKTEAEYTTKEIYSLIMAPGFSTNEEVTEFSGRGVGMDVVRQNIEQVGGNILVESEKGVGTTFTIKIPLTLAIIDGMEFSVGETIFTIPITSIKQTFKITEETKIIKDTDGAEMVMVREECYPIIRLNSLFNITDAMDDLYEGIAILIFSGNRYAVIFADDLLGEQQVVVKPFPFYLNRYQIKSYGLAGCTILGDGSISLILDAANLLNRF